MITASVKLLNNLSFICNCVLFAFICHWHFPLLSITTFNLKPTISSSQYLLILVCSLSHLTRGSVGLLSWMTAGVFVLCWSILLSPICCSSLAWKQDQERFHTYTHWPLINKSDQGPFPHIHTVPMKTKTIQTRAHTVQSRKYPRANFNRAQPHLWSQRIRPGNPDSDPSKQPFGMSEWFFFLYLKWWLFPCGTVTEHKETCSHQLFSLLSSGAESASAIVQICYLICLGCMNGLIEDGNLFPWLFWVNWSVKEKPWRGWWR